MYSSAEIEGRAFFRDLATNASGRVVLMGLPTRRPDFRSPMTDGAGASGVPAAALAIPRP